MPKEENLELDRTPESDDTHYYLPQKLHAFEVGHGELTIESMVDLNTWAEWADHRLILRPVVNTGHKNQGDN
jgi:hypothetical protein